MSNQANDTSQIDPVTGPLKILLGIPDSELSTRALARRFNLSQPVVARRLQQARSAWDHTKKRELWMLVMYGLLTASAVIAAVSLAIIASAEL